MWLIKFIPDNGIYLLLEIGVDLEIAGEIMEEAGYDGFMSAEELPPEEYFKNWAQYPIYKPFKKE